MPEPQKGGQGAPISLPTFFVQFKSPSNFQTNISLSAAECVGCGSDWGGPARNVPIAALAKAATPDSCRSGTLITSATTAVVRSTTSNRFVNIISTRLAWRLAL